MTDPRFALAPEADLPSREELGLELAAEMARRFSARLHSREKSRRAKTNRASGLGDPCLRRLVYYRTAGEQARPPGDTLLAIFNYGNMIEPMVKRIVEDLGFAVDRSQEAFPDNAWNVSGHIDGLLKHHTAPVLFVLEIKGLNGPDWGKLNTWQDIAEAEKGWLRKYHGQGQLYAALKELQRWGDDELPVVGVLYVLLNKWTGELKAIPSPLIFEEAEKLLDRSLEIEEHVAKGTLPDFVEERRECITCVFHGITCHPPMRFEGEGLQVVDEPDVIAALDALDRHEEGWTSYEEAYKFLFDKDAGGRLRGAEYVVVPHPDGGADWHVRGSFAKSVSYQVPEDVRAPYRKENPRGRYTPHIELVRRKEP